MAKNRAKDPFSGPEDIEEILEATIMADNENTVRQDFWSKMAAVAARIPFAEDVVASYFCAFDPATPLRVKGILLAAIAYFILPLDTIPDFILGLGFTDDAAVIATALAMIRTHLKPEHRQQARTKLDEVRARSGEFDKAAKDARPVN
ncbi:MAG: YkvA family protein [Hyphomicrobiales bacterium]